KIGPKLVLGFSAMVAMLAVTVYTGYRGMRQISDQATVAAAVRSIEGNVHQQRALMLTLLIENTPEAVERLKPEVEALAQANLELQQQIESLTLDTPTMSELASQFRQIRED